MNNFRGFLFSPLLVPLLILVAAPGCEKINDVPRMQDEARANVKDYQQRFDELAQRAEVIGKRGASLPPDTLNSADAKRSYAQARSKIEEFQSYLRQMPTRLQDGVTNGNPEELPKLIDELRGRLEDGVIETTSELAAVESWIAVAEQRQGAPRVPPAPATEPVSTDPPPVAPGSAAPIR